ncbi:monothiol glutaredoxin-S1-like [Andrographis paniculata]|uniref:monothiol glutaredoxin-S1-like n=1 Tax=Andrographis paniculata TaxID=175694 RepID=UPI0021E7653B|nr:monothiol glutaredoxin-S1-like [Andrographis paniculata]
MEVVERLVEDKAVVIFSKSTCGMSHAVKTLISSFGANPTVYEVDELPEGHQLEKALLSQRKVSSFPVVYIGQQLVGGEAELMSLHVKAQLVPLLKNAGAIWI